MDEIKELLEDARYDFAVAIATQAEIDNGAACGQLGILLEVAETFDKQRTDER